MGASGTLYVSFSVRNTGKVTGTEIAQVYVADDVASVVTPNKQLQGFARVEALRPGEKRDVTIQIDVATQFRLLNRDWEWVVEPGSFSVWVGPSAAVTALSGKCMVE